MGLRGMATPAPLHQVSAGAQRLVEVLCSTGVRPEKEDRDDRRQRALMVSAASGCRRVSLRTPRAGTGHDSGSETHSFPRVSITMFSFGVRVFLITTRPARAGSRSDGMPCMVTREMLGWQRGSRYGAGYPCAGLSGLPWDPFPLSSGGRMDCRELSRVPDWGWCAPALASGVMQVSRSTGWDPGPGPDASKQTAAFRWRLCRSQYRGIVGGWRLQSRSSTSRAHGRQGRLDRDRVSCCEAAAIRSMA